MVVICKRVRAQLSPMALQLWALGGDDDYAGSGMIQHDLQHEDDVSSYGKASDPQLPGS